MAAKRLNLPTVPSTVASFPLSNAPLPTPAGWWRRPSSSLSSLARDDDHGSDIHRCSCRRVDVDWLSCWLSCCCCCRPESSLLPTPPLPPPNHQRAVAVAIVTTTSIDAAVAIAIAVAITAALTSLPLSPPSSTRLSPRRRIEVAHSLNVAITGYRHFHGHRRRHCRSRCIRCSHCCCHCCHNHRSLRNNPIFWRAAKNIGVILRSQTPLSYPSQNKTAEIDVKIIHSKNTSKKNAANFEIRSL